MAPPHHIPEQFLKKTSPVFWLSDRRRMVWLQSPALANSIRRVSGLGY
jgi:hypothetical protein